MAVIAVGAVAVVVLRDDSGPEPVAPVNNVAGNFRACLVSTSGGSASSKRAWAELQDAAAGGRVNAQSFVAPASGSAGPYFNGLVGVGCDVVVVADAVLVPAATEVAAKAKQQRFLVVGKVQAGDNVEVLSDDADLSAWIARHVGA
ncbi:hypothetical protein BJ973_004039 [Actinoplanes tereljensis]|uniref:BMP family ABC transporter substrate-binding protein n=1 Tax=Paractinoplanes tereljensis TaxID=571912 RepID=A0A919NTV0_9ACTN|nr:hypothetical protein [Actinoplanes tereljensis]GIF23427.1 hypothetical protein Ate02nite_61570 [Actinoplanes tereljensis]